MDMVLVDISTVTSWLARWRLKSPASWLFTQPFIQGAGQRKHQSSASLAFVRGIHRSPVNSPHKGSVTRKMFPFDDVIMLWYFRKSQATVHNKTSSYFKWTWSCGNHYNAFLKICIPKNLKRRTDSGLHWRNASNIEMEINVILMRFSSQAAQEVIKMTTPYTASDENFVKSTFLFQWYELSSLLERQGCESLRYIWVLL